MQTRPTTGLRGLRAAAFGTATLVLAAAAHALAGGSLPSISVLLVVGVPLACASVVLARRSRGLPSLLTALGLAQLVLHETFMTATTAQCGPTEATAHAAHGMTAVGCADMPAMAGASGLPAGWMLAFHALATFATAVLLAHGERVAARIWLWMRPRVVATVRAHVAVVARRLDGVRVAQLTAQVLATSDLSRRGPPPPRVSVHLDTA